MPRSGTAARQLIREPSSCPAFQAAGSSYPVPGGGMGEKREGSGARDHPPMYRDGQAVFLCRGDIERDMKSRVG